MKKVLSVLFMLTVFCSGAQAVLITVGGDQTAGTGTLTINQDITFNITSNRFGTLVFVFDDVVGSADAQLDTANFSGLSFSVNGGGATNTIVYWTDNYTANHDDLTERDGYIYSTNPNWDLQIGDTVTLHAGTGTMGETESAFNPWSSGDYDMFLSVSGNRISDVVPEPATALSLVLGSLVIGGYRRIRKAYGL